MGGDTDPAKVKITVEDVARVAQLYPKQGDSGDATEGDGGWVSQKNTKLKVRHRGFEMVVDGPRALRKLNSTECALLPSRNLIQV